MVSAIYVLTFLHWNLRQQVNPKRWYPSTKLHGITSQKTTISKQYCCLLSAVFLGLTPCRQPDVLHDHIARLWRQRKYFRRNIRHSLNYMKFKFRRLFASKFTIEITSNPKTLLCIVFALPLETSEVNRQECHGIILHTHTHTHTLQMFKPPRLDVLFLQTIICCSV
jgi:hypothetical protein